MPCCASVLICRAAWPGSGGEAQGIWGFSGSQGTERMWHWEDRKVSRWKREFQGARNRGPWSRLSQDTTSLCRSKSKEGIRVPLALSVPTLLPKSSSRIPQALIPAHSPECENTWGALVEPLSKVPLLSSSITLGQSLYQTFAEHLKSKLSHTWFRIWWFQNSGMVAPQPTSTQVSMCVLE